MSYKVQSSEKLKPSGTENETKALLYLMGYREDSNEIYYFVIDFFNDVTGMSKQSDKLSAALKPAHLGLAFTQKDWRRISNSF